MDSGRSGNRGCALISAFLAVGALTANGVSAQTIADGNETRQLSIASGDGAWHMQRVVSLSTEYGLTYQAPIAEQKARQRSVATAKQSLLQSNTKGGSVTGYIAQPWIALKT